MPLPTRRQAAQQPCSIIATMRHLYLLLGWSFFGLGAIGVVVPGLPTTPFMLLALWAFSKSSQRFHDWLYAHPLFGPPLQRWRTHRVIPGTAKLLALLTMGISLGYLVLFSGADGWLLVLTVLLMLVGALFILGQPSRVPGTLTEAAPAHPDSDTG